MAFSTHDVVPDSPINNFAVLNSLNKITVNGAISISNGNLNVAYEASANGASFAVSSIKLPESGLWYFEATKTSGTYYGVGLHDGTMNNSYINTISWSKTSSGIIGILADMNTNTIYSYVDGSIVSSETASIPNDLRYFSIGVWSSSGNGRGGCCANFGQDHTFGGNKTGGGGYQDANGIGQFYYQPPDGALALCTKNLRSGPIDVHQDDVPSDYFKAVTWIGDGTGANRTINTDMSSDLVWVKKRSSGGAGSAWHQVFDSVRGVGKSLNTNETNSESTSSANSANHGYLDQFTSTGFSFTNGSDSSWPRHYYNDNGETYVAWCFRAGGSPADGGSSVAGSARIVEQDGTQADTTCAALASTAGASITPSKVSANRKSGFSIVKYGGSSASSSTVPHGLGKAPEMIIIKNLDSSDQWVVYHKSVASDAETDYLVLNTPAAAVDNATVWNDTAPTTQVFSIGQGGSVSESNENYIAYCWHSVAGFSKFGSYVATGSVDGPYVECGFRPAWVMIKKYEGGTSRSWLILDSTRDGHNPCDSRLYPNTSASEFGNEYNSIDILSNGFRPISASYEANESSGHKYIYAAFSEQPVNAPSNAR